MSAEIIRFSGITKLDLPVDRILDAAKEHDLDSVVVIGWRKDEEPYFASSIADGGDVLWLLELLKHKLISGEY